MSICAGRLLSMSDYKNELRKNRFVILVFYRTIWCGKYLSELQELAQHFAQMGGKIIAVSTQSLESTIQQQLDWRLKCDLICDELMDLTQKYDMVVEKNECTSM